MYADAFENEAVVAISPKVPALLSIMATCVLIREVLTDLHARSTGNRSSTCKPLSRTLLAMTVGDLCFAIPWFFGSWLFPAGDGRWGAVGNKATCTVEGFLFQVGTVAAPAFNVTFAFFSLLMLLRNWKDHQLARLEPWIQTIVWATALGSAIFPIPLGLYNPGYRICWISSYPLGCEDTDSCTRGKKAWEIAFYMVIFPVWPCIAAALVIVVLIYFAVRRNENRMAKYMGSRGQPKSSSQEGSHSSPPRPRRSSQFRASHGSMSSIIVNRDKSGSVAKQAVLFISAFFLTFSLDFVSYVLYTFCHEQYFPALDFVAYLLFPLQGFFNFLIFARPRREMKTPEGRFLRRLLCCCGSSQSPEDRGSTRVSSSAAVCPAPDEPGCDDEDDELSHGDAVDHQARDDSMGEQEPEEELVDVELDDNEESTRVDSNVEDQVP